MKRYVAFLRGINLGKRRLPMSRLRELIVDLGYEDVETFIASGNVIFSTKATKTAALESKIAKQLEESLGYEVDTFVRTPDEIRKIGELKVFFEDADTNGGVTIHVGFLHRELAPGIARKFEAIKTDLDEFRVIDREYYWMVHSDRSSDSKVWTLPELKELKLPSSTMRNLKSLRKLIAKHLE